MHLEKLTVVLKPFTKPRLKRLEEFLSSPYFHVKPVCRLLLARLTTLHPAFPEKKMNPAFIGKNIRTLSTFSKQANAATHLLHAIELFIAQEEWLKDKQAVNRYRMRGWQELKLSALFDKQVEKEMQRITGSPEHTPDLFFERHALTELSHNHFAARLNRSVGNDIMPIVKTLDEFYALKKLRYLCEALNRHQVTGIRCTDTTLPALLGILQPYTNPQYPYVYLFVNVYCMLAADNFDDSHLYYRLLKDFIEHQTTYPLPVSVIEAADYAFSYCLRWYNKGYKEAGNEYLWWIDWKMKHRLLYEKEKMLPVTFRNIVSIAVSVNKSALWLQQCINTHAAALPAAHYAANVAFAKGLLCYLSQKYKQAIRYFLTAQPKDDVVFNCNIRRWQWICLYEYDREDTDTLLNQLQAFERYLQRNKKVLHSKYDTFIQFTQHALQLFNLYPANTIADVINTLEHEEHFAGKSWLLRQLSIVQQKTRAPSARVGN